MKCVFFAALLFCGSIVHAQFNNILYGNNLDNDFSAIVPIANSGFIVTGTTRRSAIAIDTDMYIALVNNAGGIVWDITYGGTGNDRSTCAVMNNDGNIVVAGTSSSFNGGSGLDIVLVEVDLTGRIVWARDIKRPNRDDIPVRINLTPTGLVFCATTDIPNNNSPDFLLMEVSFNGNVINWQNLISNNAGTGDLCKNIIPRRQGGYILVGGSHDGNYDQVILWLNARGQIVQQRRLGSVDANEDASDVIELQNGAIIVMGNFRRISGNGLEVALTRINNLGNIDFIRTYGDNGNSDERAYGLVATNLGYAIAGYTNNIVGGREMALLLNTDLNGILLSSSVYGGLATDERGLGLLYNAVDNNLTIVGNTNKVFPQGGGRNGFLLQTNNLFQIQDNCFASAVVQRNPNLNFRAGFVYIQSNPLLTLTNNITTNSNMAFFLSSATNCRAVLPVDYLYYTAKCQHNEIYLKWATASEFNSRQFEVEKSSDTQNWKVIGVVDSKGGESTMTEYDFIDTEIYLSQSNVYYRLKQIDIDGSFTYSSVISVSCEKNINESSIDIFPNPVGGDSFKLHCFNLNERGGVEVSVRDVSGKILLVEYFDEINLITERDFSVKKLKKGIYFVNLTSLKTTIQGKFVKL